MLHYNFPPYSVGEAGFMSGPKRREIGHGKLARRGVSATLPNPKTSHTPCAWFQRLLNPMALALWPVFAAPRLR